MTRDLLLRYLRAHPLAVVSSLAADGAPQAALVGVAVTDAFEMVFDTLAVTRKAMNLRRDRRTALVFGGGAGDERTVQCEGLADEPQGEERERALAAYFAAFPDGRQRQAWPGLIHVRVRPTWLRHSDYGVAPPRISELTAVELASLG